jgi:hypothetical protein
MNGPKLPLMTLVACGAFAFDGEQNGQSVHELECGRLLHCAWVAADNLRCLLQTILMNWM